MGPGCSIDRRSDIMKLTGRRVRIGRRTAAIGTVVAVAGPVSLLATFPASARAGGNGNGGRVDYGRCAEMGL
jgi:hypothetical protein